MEAAEDGVKVEFPYQPGTVKRIMLQNFMCHEKFDLDLGPRVNFIIGPNGSGKSALLTALVVVLGGRATTTSRARKVSDFVQEGKRVAKITCVIHNYERIMERDQAFRPDEFGKEIVVEKTIYKDDGRSNLVLKDEKMRKVSERKQVLDDILEHFKILINNPICILNQEVSKSFLHSKRPEDKFDLFMKATNLEQIENDYEEAKQAFTDWDGINTKKSVSFKLLDKEYAECKEKINFIQNRLKLQDRSEALCTEMLWASIRDREDEAKEIEERNQAIEKRIDKDKAEITRREEAISTAESEIQQARTKIAEIQDNSKDTRDKLDELRRKEQKLRPEKVSVDATIDSTRNRLARLDRNKVQIENKIKSLRIELGKQDSQADEEARRKMEQDRLEYEITTEKSNEKTRRSHIDQLINSMTETRADINRANLKLNDMNSEIMSKNSHLRRLIGGRDSELKKYGEHMVKICAMVDTAFKEGVFSKKPRGPLGCFIKLKTPKISKALEIHLGKNAHAFTVDNVQDMGKLASIIRKVKSTWSGDFRDPLILTRRFADKHDVSRFKASDGKYHTLLDLVDIEDSCVYNALIDRTSLEQILFIEDYFEAQNVMLTPASIPRGTRCAYTENGDTMFPRTNRGGFRIVGNNRKNLCLFSKGNDDQIREFQQEIAELKERMDLGSVEIKRLQKSYDDQRQEFSNNQSELKEICDKLKEKEAQLFKIKTAIPVAQPQELSDLEGDLEEILVQIRDTRVEMEREKLKLESLETEIRDLRQKKELNEGFQKKRDGEIQKLTDSIEKKRELISDNKSTISNQLLTNIKKAEQTLVENKAKLEKIYQQIALANVDENERPNVIRATHVIRSDQESVSRQLQVEIDENQEPLELVENYKKRMLEIEKTVTLKEHNLKNHKLGQKSLKDREEGTQVLRNHTTGSVSSTFASVMSAMDMEGKLSIHMNDHVVNGKIISKARTLEMSIDTTRSQRPSTLSMSERNASTPAAERRSSRTQPGQSSDAPQSKRARMNLSPSEKENQRMTDTRSLSGGERSFSTVAFVLALWHHCASPFKLMDEIDVFMDMVTRRMSYNALIKFAEASENPGQFIYFSPLQLPEIEATKGLVKVLAMPSIVRRGQSQGASLRATGGDTE